MDVAITNAWIYYKLTNKELGDKDGSRADFYQSLAESLVNINIDGKDRYRECEKKENVGDDDKEVQATSNFIPTEECKPFH